MKNKIIKKMLAASMVGIMALSMAGCGKTEAETESETPVTETEENTETTPDTEQAPENTDEADVSRVMEEEYSEAAIMGFAEDIAPEIDITGCDTFTQIVDSKLSPGMGYTNVDIGDVNALIVCSGAYDNLDGNMAAIDGTVFIYKDGAPYQAGKICSGGTAYPLVIKDGKLMSASNHWAAKYLIINDRVTMVEHGAVAYNPAGDASYSYDRIDEYSDGSEVGEPEEMLNKMYEDMGSGEVLNFDVISDGSEESAALPAYEYPGPELFYTVMYQYMIDELGQHYDTADVGIPCPIIIAEDDSDKNDIKVWGDFWYYNYTLNGDTLECVSGGSYPGCMHFTSTDEGYEVTEFEIVADGSDYDPSAKKIFGDHYDELIKTTSDKEAIEQIRAQIIANYAAANNLPITAYKDFGWDPVTLPEENIDSFYSKLD